VLLRGIVRCGERDGGTISAHVDLGLRTLGGLVLVQLSQPILSLEDGGILTPVPVSFSIPKTQIKVTYRERLAATGASVPLLFIASDGARERGVRILISDMLLWTLKPKPTDDQLPVVAAQLGKPHLTKAITASGADAFLAEKSDCDLPLRTDNSPDTWNPNQKLE
jgi:hypothetical protein